MIEARQLVNPFMIGTTTMTHWPIHETASRNMPAQIALTPHAPTNTHAPDQSTYISEDIDMSDASPSAEPEDMNDEVDIRSLSPDPSDYVPDSDAVPARFLQRSVNADGLQLRVVSDVPSPDGIASLGDISVDNQATSLLHTSMTTDSRQLPNVHPAIQDMAREEARLAKNKVKRELVANVKAVMREVRLIEAHANTSHKTGRPSKTFSSKSFESSAYF
ncbi:hypothetical protein BKA62DRAFT_769089 [Auriculariales sp. MPI-PUGE-AT-0066]|nr:hypothetical protein BKA62DRAFT_769089 [Auriculariales sp. MPI-PUGE-AT-0066]